MGRNRRKYEKKDISQQGITLIALVITIIVLLILAGVSISLVAGNNGILGRATEAVNTNQKAKVLEEAEMVLSGWQTDYIVEKTPYEGRSETTTSGAIVSCTGGKVTVTDNKIGTVYEASFTETTGFGEWKETGKEEETPDVPTDYGATHKEYSGEASEGTNYVGYYADIDYDGTVDGVIYADLRFTVSGQWNNDSDSSFSYTAISSTNSYYISTYKYNGKFGEKNVIIPKTSNSSDRFYVMALNNVDSSYHDFYNAAYNNSSFGALAVASTTNDFGQGREKTRNLITAWNNKTYGEQNQCSSHTDMWSLSAVQACASNKWFVPSRAEWSAFGYNLGITTSNYSGFGLSNYYWSSSVRNSASAWGCTFSYGCITGDDVYNYFCVRLSATF